MPQTTKFVDITGAKDIEITIRADGKVVWINTIDRCIVRICRISETIIIVDNREVEE